jgi:hypothetical protein
LATIAVLYKALDYESKAKEREQKLLMIVFRLDIPIPTVGASKFRIADVSLSGAFLHWDTRA